MKMKMPYVTPAIAYVVIAFGLTGCGNMIAKYMGPSDYAKLVGFHDTALEKDSSTVRFESQQSGFTGKDVWSQDFALSAAGLAKVHVSSVPNATLPDAKGYAGYAPAYFEVSVNSKSAKNLKWEVWMSGNQYQWHSAWGSTSIDFQKIMGPFKAGETIKIDYLKGKVDSYGQQYQARQPVIVVYSPSERGEQFTVDVYKPQLTKP